MSRTEIFLQYVQKLSENGNNEAKKILADYNLNSHFQSNNFSKT
jgi:hypothetical protein